MMKFLVVCCVAATLMAADGDWPTYGRDLAGTRFSPLKQITRANVNQLSRAWTYHMKPAAVSGSGRVWEVSPVVVDGVMYLTTAYNRVVALDPQTGTELWSYEVKGGTTRSAWARVLDRRQTVARAGFLRDV